MTDPFVDPPSLAPRQPSREYVADASGVFQLAQSAPFAVSADAYLLTKVMVPPVRASVLPRSPLIELLERRLPLTLVSAGAGYGKTTLLAIWAYMQQGHVAWLTLENLENDPLRFWAYVLLALRAGIPSLEEKVSAWLEAMDAAAIPSLLTALLNEVVERDEALTLILDDYQVIEEPEIGQSLAFLLAHAPACLRLVLVTRADPLLPLARLRAYGQLMEIREAQLRLSPSEAGQFLADIMDLQLSEADVQALWERTEGWVAGLQLTALALRQHPDHSQEVQRISGSHQYLVEYVQEDILAQVEPTTQTFLLQTSVLPQLTASLCQAVTGDETSEERLQALERANLFVVPLDAERRWYRLHALVREALLARLRARKPERVAHLHRLASHWYAQQQLFPEAIAHALDACAWNEAADLIERSTELQSWRNAYPILRGWLSRLPDAVLHGRPQLCSLAAQALFFTTPIGAGTMPGVDVLLQLAMQGYRASDQTGEGSVLAIRASLAVFQGRFSAAFATAREALALLPDNDMQWRGLTQHVLGVEALMAGELPQARTLFQHALLCYETTGLLGGRQGVALLLADVSLLEGDRARAVHGFYQVLGLLNAHPEQAQTQLIDTLGKRRAHFEYAASYSLAGLAYEENRLQEAQHWLEMALIEGQFALIHVLTPGLLLQVRMLKAAGKGEQAATLLLDLEMAVREPGFAREIRLCQAWLARVRGDLVALEAWATSLAQDEIQPLSCARREEEALLLSRLRIAQEQPEEAVLLLEPLLEEAKRTTREWSVLRIQLVLALAEQARGKRMQAKRRLLEVVGRASGSHIVRPFLEEGEAMEQLLRELVPDLRDDKQAAYVDTLLHAFAHVPLSQEGPVPTARATPALTPQEQRVLALLAQGDSNQEIARALVIERSTAKSHISHLLHKLGATTRTQAIARAREWGLL